MDENDCGRPSRAGETRVSDAQISPPALRSCFDRLVDSAYRRTGAPHVWLLIGGTTLALLFALIPVFVALLGTMLSEYIGEWPDFALAVEIAALFGTATLIWVARVHHGTLIRCLRSDPGVDPAEVWVTSAVELPQGAGNGRKKILPAMATAGVAIAMILSNAEAANAVATTCPGFVAHRGEITPPQNYTEDGLLAETLGINDPRYAAVEDDAWPTLDGKGFLMMHDSTVDRATNGSGRISDHSLTYWQSHIRMNDGSVPMSLPQYLALFSQYQAGHGYLHVRSDTALSEMARELNAAAVEGYVAVVANTVTRLKTIHSLAPTYPVAYITGSSIDTDTSHQISIAKTYGQKRIVLAKPSWSPSSTALKALFAAGLTVEWTTYSAGQDTIATRWDFSRVLTYDVEHLRALYPAGVCT